MNANDALYALINAIDFTAANFAPTQQCKVWRVIGKARLYMGDAHADCDAYVDLLKLADLVVESMGATPIALADATVGTLPANHAHLKAIVEGLKGAGLPLV
jgi:dsDNA-binding SOS-regulon protein